MMRPASDRDASFADRTARLLLRVDQLFTTAQTAEMGYVARVRDVTPGRPQAMRDSVSEVVIPVGGGGFRDLEVRPGSYLIEAVTPTGAVLEADVEVGDGETQTVALADDTPSPHEWLGWQKVSGNLPGFAGPAVAAARRQPWTLWLAIGGGLVVLLVVLALAAAYFTLQPKSASYESLDASAEIPEAAAPEGTAAKPDAAPTPAGAEAPVPRETVIKRLPPGRRPAALPDSAFVPEPQAPGDGLVEKDIRRSAPKRATASRPARPGFAPPPPPPPEASGSGAPPPAPVAVDRPATAPPAAAPPASRPPTSRPPTTQPEPSGLDGSKGLPNGFWLIGLGLLAAAGGGVELARRGMIPGLGALGRQAAKSAEPPPTEAIFKSAKPEGAPLAPGPTASSLPGLAEGPARLTLLTLPSGPGEWAMMLAALESRAALSGAYAASQGLGREPQAEGRDAQWSTYSTLPLNSPDCGRPLWAVDNPPAGRAEAVRLPEHWIMPESGQPVAIEIMTSAEGREERVSTAVRDPAYGTLLGYLAMGRLPEARALLGQAAEALFGKTINPYLAAAGGYVLVGSATSYDDAPWRGWLQTLDVQYPWLPDAAVLQAVSMVQTRQDGVRAKALEAMDRGVPVYTEGLKRLRDLLTLLVEQPDPDGRVAQSLDAVSRLAGRCNPQQVFTSLRLGA